MLCNCVKSSYTSASCATCCSRAGDGAVDQRWQRMDRRIHRGKLVDKPVEKAWVCTETHKRIRGPQKHRTCCWFWVLLLLCFFLTRPGFSQPLTKNAYTHETSGLWLGDGKIVTANVVCCIQDLNTCLLVRWPKIVNVQLIRLLQIRNCRIKIFDCYSKN